MCVCVCVCVEGGACYTLAIYSLCIPLSTHNPRYIIGCCVLRNVQHVKLHSMHSCPLSREVCPET